MKFKYYCVRENGFVFSKLFSIEMIECGFADNWRNTNYIGDSEIRRCPYIGLPDKNGADIYAGDILQIRTQSGRIENFTVEYGIHRRDMKSGWTVDIPSFAFVSDEGHATYPIVNNYWNGHDLEILEVIGNIYQNADLLIKKVDADIIK